MIQVVLYRNVFEPETKEISFVETDTPVELASVVPDWLDLGALGVTVTVNGDERIDGEVNPGDQVIVVASPKWQQILIAIISIIVSVAITKSMMDEEPPAQDENAPGDEGFQGFRNDYFSGGAIPIILGERRIAPPVVGQVVESSYAAWSLSDRETLRLLFVLGHGPIEGIGSLTGVASTDAELAAITEYPLLTGDMAGLQINGQASDNYTDVVLQWRTGEWDQTPLTSFPDSSVDITIDQFVKEYSTSIDITDTGKPSAVLTSGNDIDSAAGESLEHTMTDEGDRYVVTVSFPKGLYKDDKAGGEWDSTATLRIQFWPVDNVGTRTGDTILLPEVSITGDTREERSYNITGKLFSPQSYAPRSQLGYLECHHGTSLVVPTKYAEIDDPVFGSMFPAGSGNPATCKFSTTCWIRPRNQPAGVAIYGGRAEGVFPIFNSQKGTSYQHINASSAWHTDDVVGLTTGTGSGTMFSLVRTWHPNFTSAGNGRWKLQWCSWSGASYVVHWADVPSSFWLTDSWSNVGMSYDATKSSAPTFYIHGNPIGPTQTTSVGGYTHRFTSDPTAPFRIGWVFDQVPGIAPSADFDLCSLVISNEQRDQSWFTKQLGVVTEEGQTLAVGFPSMDPLICFSSMLSEEIAPGFIESLTFPGENVTGKVLRVVGGALQVAPQTDAPLWYPATGNSLRGRYHLEVYRSNAETDDPGEEVNVMIWDTLTIITDEDFSHPGVAMGGLSIDADDQVNNARPDFSMLVRGLKVPVWDGGSSEFPTFNATWTRNPAWNAYWLVTEEEAALGSIFGHAGGVDLEAFKVWADYCDEGVEDAAGTPAFIDGDFVAISTDHIYGEVHLKLSLLDAAGASTGVQVPDTWVVGGTIKIKTASDASWTVASSDASARLTITSMMYEDDAAAPLGTSHWLQVEADWVDGYTLPTASNVTGTVVGVESRHECDTIINGKDVDGWDELITLMRSARAAPVILGNKLSCFVDRERPVDFFITQAQMLEGSLTFTWESIEDRYNSIELEYADRLQNYDLEVLQEDHPSISGDVGASMIRKAPPKMLRGVVRRTEVRRQAIYRLNQWALLDTAASFKLGTDGLGLAPGDHLRIAHDVPFIGESGRVFADGAATTIKLDRDIIVAFGSTYEIEVRSSGSVDGSGKEIVEVVALHASMIPGSGTATLSAGSAITLAGSGFATMVPQQGDVYSIGKTGLTAEDFTVLSVTLDAETMIRSVKAISYNAAVYLDNTFTDMPDDPVIGVPPNTGRDNDGGFGGGVKRPGDFHGSSGFAPFTANESTHLSAGGKPVVQVTVAWAKQQLGMGSAGGSNIWLADVTDGLSPVPRKVGYASPGATTLKLDGLQLRAGQTARFYRQPLNSKGEGRAAIVCASADLAIGARVRERTHAAPVVLAAKSRQSHAVYPIQFPEGNIPEGVEVRVGGWLLGQKVVTALRDGDLESTQWVFGADNAASAGAYTHQVRSLLPSGQVSAAATFKNSDALPLGMTSSSSIAHEDAWAGGTLDGLQITSGYLNFSAGSHLEGSWTTPALDLTVACRWLLEIVVQAEQRHPTLLEARVMGEPLESRVYANWLLEGPTGGVDAQACHLSLEWLPTDTATLPSAAAWATVRPGEVYFRKAQFRVRVTRPTATFDCKIERFGVRVLDLPDYHPGDLDGGTF